MSSDAKVPHRLLTSAEVNRVSWRHLWIMFWGWLACAIQGIGLVLLLDKLSRLWPMNSPQFNSIATAISILFLVAVGVTLGFAYLKYKAVKLVCPNCHTDITKWTMQIVSTRCCCMCWQRILDGGKARTPEEYNQLYSRINSTAFIVRIVQLIFIGLIFWFAPVVRQNPLLLVALGLYAGCFDAKYLITTKDWRNLVGLIGCCCLIGLGIWLHFSDMQ